MCSSKNPRFCERHPILYGEKFPRFWQGSIRENKSPRNANISPFCPTAKISLNKIQSTADLKRRYESTYTSTFYLFLESARLMVAFCYFYIPTAVHG